MRFHTRPTFRRTAITAALLAVATALFLFLFSHGRDERLFEQLADDLFLSEMTANTLNMHYTLAFPEDFGIQEYEAILPCYSFDDDLSALTQTENLLNRLRDLNESRLSDRNRYTLTLLENTLENSLALSNYPYYEEPLSPSSGMQSQLPILLAEYTFRSVRDVEDYLDILDQTDEYFEALLLYEQEKADVGLLMPSVSLLQVVEQCDTILTKEELDSGTHFLQTTFAERLEGLIADGKLTSQKAESYQALNDRLLRTVMLPAYEALGDGLLVLEDPAIPLRGLAAQPDGAAYYEQLLISQTGSYRPVSEIKEMVVTKLYEEYQNLLDILSETPDLVNVPYDTLLEQEFPYKNAAEMLVDLQKRMSADFPPLDANEPLPGVAVKAVSENLQDYCAPAFYLTPPLDDTSSNAIYINEKSTPAGLELYTTLAHEGYPGHMYQSVYHNRNTMDASDDSSNHVRELLWYGGYLEGWALYVEFISYDYASQLYQEIGTADSSTTNTMSAAIQLIKHDRSLQLSLYSLIDIMIHYENASKEQVANLLHNFGISSKTAVSAIYEYIVEEPTNYLKYYLGYLEILELKETARELWGNNYSDYEFHTFFLDCGPADFTFLEERLAELEVK
ncbi:MAG: DUF885 domain-containing protein [Lachnospiraceae bacterium]|nr:DUF885 domain-containing protein [Lachnospiraceae bacterium]